MGLARIDLMAEISSEGINSKFTFICCAKEHKQDKKNPQKLNIGKVNIKEYKNNKLHYKWHNRSHRKERDNIVKFQPTLFV